MPALAADPDSAFVEVGRLLFAQPCTFVHGTMRADQLPPISVPEIAFAGRSNVGKSSLVNALTGRKALARTSNTPGRTQQLNFFALGDALRLVDMPGYGFASVSKSVVAGWGTLIGDFLRGRVSLLRVFLLVDARHGLKPSDLETMTAFDKAAISYVVVLTKADAVKAEHRAVVTAVTEAAIARRPAAFPTVMLTSAETGEGIAALRGAVARLLAERGGLMTSSP